MSDNEKTHPYIPNSAPRVKKEMLDYIGVDDSEKLYAGIPDELRYNKKLALPEPIESEIALKRHINTLMQQNTSCDDVLSFLGGGCYQHQIPAVCDEINGRAEFLTAYGGEPYDDHGRFQAIFEYCSMMAELLEMEVVSVPCYDGYQASSTAISMATRITGKSRILVSGNIDPDKLSMMRNYTQSYATIELLPLLANGVIDYDKLKQTIHTDTAAVYFEVPAFMGQIEDAQMLVNIIHKAGALAIVSVNPISLGVLTPPGSYGADIACGDIQPLGIHMQYGGGQGGFIASQNIADIVYQYPSRLFGLIPTKVDGEYGFGDVAFSRTSFDSREQGNEFVGTASALWGITAGVYLALMGPHGMKNIGEHIMRKTQYAKQALQQIKHLNINDNTFSFQEFVVDFNKTGLTVREINRQLRKRNIFAGHDLSYDFPNVGQSALYCFSEIHTKKDIDILVLALQEVIAS